MGGIMTEYKIRAKQAPELTRVLKRGCQGDDVILLQTRLMEIGFNLGSYGADGYFGGRTRDAVDDFLCANGLKPAGEMKTAGWELLYGEIRFAQFNNSLFKCLCRENGYKFCDGYYMGGINPAIKIMLARIQDKMRDRTGIANLNVVVKSNKTAYEGNGGYRCRRWNQKRAVGRLSPSTSMQKRRTHTRPLMICRLRPTLTCCLNAQMSVIHSAGLAKARIPIVI